MRAWVFGGTLVLVTTLVLADVPEPVWNAFQAGKSRALVSLRDRDNVAVVERWQRAASLGAPADGPDDEAGLVRGAALRARDERFEAVAQSGEHALGLAAHELSARDFVLLLADPDGVVVRSFGGGAFAQEARRVRLIEGALWNEAARGTNAIGTAIVENRAVHVHGRSHFGRRFHGLCCYAAPVHFPNGEIALVLDATSYAERADAAVGVAIAQAARALEDVLRGHAYAQAGVSVTRLLARTFERLDHPVMLIEAPGRIVRANDAARALMLRGLGSEGLGALGLPLSYEQLVREVYAPNPRGLRVHGPGGTFVVRVDPIEASAGELLGLVLHLERDLGRRSAAPLSCRSEADDGAPISTATASGRRSPGTFFGGRLFAEDQSVREAATFAERMAPSELPIMLLAETGTGKELFATGIHGRSARARGPFVALNCGSFVSELLASELFGHGPAAFTGADPRGRHGLLHAASGGTLFLDEVAEMPLTMQAALLRVLETGTYLRVGETRPQKTDVRLICATCRDLSALVETGEFRKDLYYRLRGVTVRIPPLRARTDVAALAHHLLAELDQNRVPARTFDPSFVAWLARHPFPGNVRELRSLLSVAIILADDRDVLTLDDLPADLTLDLAGGTPAESADEDAAESGDLRVVKWKLAKDTLDALSGNVSAAARKLGVARSTLYRMMRERRNG